MNNKAGCGSVGIAGTLTIVFIVLKLCGLIAWSWTWVLSPLWITAIGWVILLMIALLIGGKK
jgi:hypothetical protein